MALKKSIFLLAFFITVFLFLTILVVGNMLGDKRQAFIDKETQKTSNSLYEMQTFWLMSETYGNEMACIAYKTKLDDLDKSVWDLGQKLDQYRAASEEFKKDPYYIEQKTVFNENEVMYMMLLRKLKKTCDYNPVVVLFFYKNSQDCKKCDDQSFVLTDINKDIDKEISIFSYDDDLNLTTINLLKKFYKIDQFPCTVIEDQVYCGMEDKDFIMRKICESNPQVSDCKKYTTVDHTTLANNSTTVPAK